MADKLAKPIPPRLTILALLRPAFRLTIDHPSQGKHTKAIALVGRLLPIIGHSARAIGYCQLSRYNSKTFGVPSAIAATSKGG